MSQKETEAYYYVRDHIENFSVTKEEITKIITRSLSNKKLPYTQDEISNIFANRDDYSLSIYNGVEGTLRRIGIYDDLFDDLREWLFDKLIYKNPWLLNQAKVKEEYLGGVRVFGYKFICDYLIAIFDGKRYITYNEWESLLSKICSR